MMKMAHKTRAESLYGSKYRVPPNLYIHDFFNQFTSLINKKKEETNILNTRNFCFFIKHYYKRNDKVNNTQG